MALTLDQERYIQNYVYQVVTYQETYEEVSDHLITALDKQAFATENELAAAMAQLLEEDFGGISLINSAEKEFSKGLAEKWKISHVRALRSFLRNTWIWCGLSAVFVVLHKTLLLHYNNKAVLVLFWLLALLPIIYQLPFRFAQWGKKKSIKNRALNVLGSRLSFSFSALLIIQIFDAGREIGDFVKYMYSFNLFFLIVCCALIIRLMHREMKVVRIAND